MILNKISLIGNLTRDPEVRFIPSGKAVCEITLALNREFKQEDGTKKKEAVFVDVTLWGRHAELAGDFLRKGNPVLINGRLDQDSWTDKQSGQKRTKLKVTAEDMQLFPREGTSAPTSRPNGATPRPAPAPRDPDLDVEPSDIPF